MIAPSTNRITQGIHGKYNAVDYSGKDATGNWNKTFYAPEDGKITAYGPSGTCGNRLELTAGSNRHGFCHLERPLVSVGQSVKKGQAIGVMGYTGYTIPTGINGTHLHWVINRNGVYIYPPSLINETNQGAERMDSDAKVKAQYYTLRGSEGTASERKGWIGKTYEEFNAKARAEVNAREAQRKNLETALATTTKERDDARAKVATLTAELLVLSDRDKAQKALLVEKEAEIKGLNETIATEREQKEKQLEEIKRVIEIKDNEIARLSKELETCQNTSGDCDSKTGWQLIALGIKKLLGKE